VATTITAVQGTSISHAVFIDLTLGSTTYYLSSAYNPVTIGSNTYTELGAYLQMSEMTEDLKTTNGDVIISLSGIPSEADYLSLVLDPTIQIKGGEVKIQRAFFDTDTLLALPGQVFTRYEGIITNWAIEEDTDFISGELVNRVSVVCASINSLLESKVTGQNTNTTSRQRFYPGDISFDRVKTIQNTSFDFGKEYTGGNGYGGYNGGPGNMPFNPNNIPRFLP
jgi:hypothetical protein